MAIDLTTQPEYRQQLLTALRNAIQGLDTGTSGDAYLKAGAIAHVLEGLSGKLKTVSESFFPAEGLDSLKRWAEIYEVLRRDPSASEGDAEFTGTPGATIAAGTKFTKADGWEYELDALATIGVGGSITAACTATAAGADGNCESGEAFTLTSPPAGVDSTATADTDFSGGTDQESEQSWLGRLLNRIQSPPAGGTENDWEQWCLNVDGVLEAYAFPELRGLGTIDLVVFTEGPGGARAIPGAGLLASVTTYLEDVRPVGMKSFEVRAATEVTVAVTYVDLEVDEDEGYDPTTQAGEAEDALEDVFPTLAPGETLYPKTHLDPAVAGTAGVLDYTRTAPAANVEPTVDASDIEVLVAGAISVTPA